MARNVGINEMTIRYVGGMILVVLGLAQVLKGGWAMAGYVLGGIAVVSGLVGYCPLWSVLGVSTLRRERRLAGQ